MVNRFFLLTLALFFSFLSFSQKPGVQKLSGKKAVSNDPVTAIAVRSETNLGTTVLVLINTDTVAVPIDPDAPEFTYFISLKKAYLSPQIQVLTPSTVEVFLINSGPAPSVESSHRRAQDDCDFSFSAISQNDWRAGLDPPSYSRSFTNVLHAVVHHAAGSNTNTNYTQVVRDIYQYHTQVNGWSDIGYNYLIAQNGDIYAGRDPASGAQDNVLGAHFCGSNSGTMGICLLGNYETANATNATWNSLQQVIAFKLNKEGLDPQSNYPHAFGSLGSIVGHRDGCSTLCPGENVYNRLSALRNDIDQVFTACAGPSLNFAANTQTPQVNEVVTFTNQSSGFDAYKWILEGAEPDTAFWPTEGTSQYSFTGSYDVTIIGFMGSDPTDTLIKTDYINVDVDGTLNFIADARSPTQYQDVTFTNESQGFDSYWWILPGGDPDSASWDKEGSTRYGGLGFHDVMLIGLLNGAPEDTLAKENYIEVEKGALAFPNPVSSFDEIQILSSDSLSSIKLYDLGGTEFLLRSQGNNRFIVPELETGVYLIQIPSSNGLNQRKIIVD